MSKFINSLTEAWGTISEQEAAAPIDPAALPPPMPPSGPVVQADDENIESPGEPDLDSDAIALVSLARKTFFYALETNRSNIDDGDIAKLSQTVTSENHEAIRSILERLVGDNENVDAAAT